MTKNLSNESGESVEDQHTYASVNMTQDEINEQFIQTLGPWRELYYKTLLNETNLTVGMKTGGARERDMSFVKNRFTMITRMKDRYKDLDQVFSQFNFEQAKTTAVVESIIKKVETVRSKRKIAQSVAAKMTLLRRDFLVDVAEKIGSEPVKSNLVLTPFEERATIDGKVFFLVLGRADIADQIEGLIKAEKWEELTEFIMQFMMQMIDKASPGAKNFNMEPLKQTELRKVNVFQLVADRQKTLAAIQWKVVLPPSYFEGAIGQCLPKLLKQR